MDLFKNLFGGDKDGPSGKTFTDEEFIADYKLKEQGLENVLGTSADVVGHAMIPFKAGGFIDMGMVDMHYFPNHIPGTGFATMELLDPAGKGPKPNKLGTYELVAFTKQPYNAPNETQESLSGYDVIERRVCDTLTRIGHYAYRAVLNPMETCQIPDGNGGYKFILFAEYKPDGKAFKIGKRKHHLLLCIEIFEKELETIEQFGIKMFVEMLKMTGQYPYSDLDRNPIKMAK